MILRVKYQYRSVANPLGVLGDLLPATAHPSFETARSRDLAPEMLDFRGSIILHIKTSIRVRRWDRMGFSEWLRVKEEVMTLSSSSVTKLSCRPVVLC